jgi:hypothetical protein
MDGVSGSGSSSACVRIITRSFPVTGFMTGTRIGIACIGMMPVGSLSARLLPIALSGTATTGSLIEGFLWSASRAPLEGDLSRCGFAKANDPSGHSWSGVRGARNGR